MKSIVNGLQQLPYSQQSYSLFFSLSIFLALEIYLCFWSFNQWSIRNKNTQFDIFSFVYFGKINKCYVRACVYAHHSYEGFYQLCNIYTNLHPVDIHDGWCKQAFKTIEIDVKRFKLNFAFDLQAKGEKNWLSNKYEIEKTRTEKRKRCAKKQRNLLKKSTNKMYFKDFW